MKISKEDFKRLLISYQQLFLKIKKSLMLYNSI